MVKNFGNYIRTLRGEKTLKEVKSIAGVSIAYLSKIENGKRSVPSPEVLKRLAPAYNTTYEELMFAGGYMGNDTADELNGFTKEEMAMIIDFAKFIKKEHEKQKK